MENKQTELRNLLQKFFAAAGDYRWAEAESLQLEVDFNPNEKAESAAKTLDQIEREISALLGTAVESTIGSETLAERSWEWKEEEEE